MNERNESGHLFEFWVIIKKKILFLNAFNNYKVELN